MQHPVVRVRACLCTCMHLDICIARGVYELDDLFSYKHCGEIIFDRSNTQFIFENLLFADAL